MRRSLRLVAVLAAIAATLVMLPEETSACSCDYPNPHEWLIRSDGAFVGALVELPEDESRGERGVIEGDYIFQVEQAVKGDFPDTVAVRAPLDGAACGFELGVGQRIGLFLYLEDGHWKSNLCSQIAADVLLAAAEPLPEPDGEGPIVGLASFITPEGRTIALDAEGNTLAYGAGRGEVGAYAFCPGARTVVEHVFDPTDDGLKYLVGVRDLRGFHIMREIVGEDVPGVISVTDIACLDPDGDEILLLAVGDVNDPRNGRIMRVRGDTIETVAEFPEQPDCYGQGGFDIPNGLAYFTGGPECRVLFRHNLETSETEEIASIPESSVSSPWIAYFSLSPDGRYLALEEHSGPRIHTFRLMIADLQADPISFTEGVYRSGDFGTGNFWLADDRILLSGAAYRGQSLIVDPRLETVATITDLPAGPGGIQGDNIYVIGFGGRLFNAPAAGGQARELRSFLDPDVRAFIVLPQAVPFDPTSIEADNFAAAPTVKPTADPQETNRAATDDVRDTSDSQDAGALTTGRVVGAGIVVVVAGAAGVLGVVSRRPGRGIEP